MNERDPEPDPRPDEERPRPAAPEVDEGDDVTSAEETAERADVGHS